MGHALNNTLQDILIRFKKMMGFNALWVPGTDHAGIATQNVVEKDLAKEGKRKEDIGREAFLKRVWEWKEKYGGQITLQLRRLGCALDWTRERFTMDEGCSKAVRKHFVDLYKEGLIYRGKRIVNWCPRCKTALSDIEVEHYAEKGKLWHIKYPFEEDPDKYVIVATTRPETMLGDTAVAVNPKDKRFVHMAGKMLILPLVNRKLPIIKDDLVDLEFGTGAVKVTPAHDAADFEMGERHHLPRINILTPNAKITLSEFEEFEKKDTNKYEGLDRFKAREEIVKDLEEKGYLEKIEDYEVALGKCYRCKTVIEPYLSDQWFVNIKPLAEPAIRIVEEGQLKYIPNRWNKVYIDWMVNLRDWCISRQIWWGHRIPVWYCKSEIPARPAGGRNPKSETNFCEEIIVSEETPTKCPKCGGAKLEQDPDVLDTWFSSALWPFSTLGWPEKTNDLKTFYPTSVLITGYDIITFWVSRMIMAGLKFMGEKPFSEVYIHGLVRDVTGKKMSKSLGNVIDPVDVINHAGGDALRFALTSLVTGQGQDIKISENKITECRNFANKIWNVSRFVLMNVQGSKFEVKNLEPRTSCLPARPAGGPAGTANLELADQWILSRYNQRVREVTDLLESYDFGEAARRLYDFIWSEFCDWYVEMAKSRIYSDNEDKEIVLSVLVQVLDGTLKLLHPFMPFITEEVWQLLKAQSSPPEADKTQNSIMLSEWPKVDESLIDLKIDEQMNLIMEVIRAIRNIRSAMNVPVKSEAEAILVVPDKEKLLKGEQYLKSLAKLSKIEMVPVLKEKPKQTATAVVGDIQIYIPLEGLIDIQKEVARLKRNIEKIENEVKRIDEKLSHKQFIENASQEVVNEAREEKKTLEQQKTIIANQIQNLSR
jgi:valyl-tRNA synthetase